MINTDVIVIGGGAAGLMAAITAARCGAKTLIIEHMDRVGKKILSTGNGKCNYTNAQQGISYYRGENPAFVLPILEQFGHEETVQFFKELGIYPKIRKGYFYPASEQASAVLDVLRMECEYQKVRTVTSCNIKAIKRTPDGYRINTDKDAFSTNKIIFATGLLAAPKTGSDGSAIPYIEGLGHHFIDVVPALVQLQGKQSFFKSLAGIRAEVSIDLYIENARIRDKKPQTVTDMTGWENVCRENGELQLTDFGISGIPVFQISRFATRALHESKAVCALIDFLPTFTEAEALEMLKQRFYDYAHGKDTSEALVGLFNKKLIDVLLKESRIDSHLLAEQIKQGQLERLCATIKRFRVDIIGSKPVDTAQVCAGGIDTREVNGQTLESKLAKGVYFAGEVLDIDGTCGGYNLQWAWSSGYVAGVHAADFCEKNQKSGKGLHIIT